MFLFCEDCYETLWIPEIILLRRVREKVPSSLQPRLSGADGRRPQGKDVLYCVY